jgi:hypothetical protein
VIDDVASRGPRRRWSWLGSRLALGLSPTPLSGLFLPIGVLLGPEGLRLLSPRVLAFADPLVSVALAALGVLIGLGLDMRRKGEARLLTAASFEAGLTITVVGAGLLAVGAIRPLPGLGVELTALLLGVCAAASSTAFDSGRVQAVATRVGDLDDVLPIVIGGIALALLRDPAPAAAGLLTLQVIGLALAIGTSGWLLVSQSASEQEQRVFTIGTILLLGGVAEFLSLSPLLAGLVAGALWNGVGGNVRDRIAQDVRHMQHPLVVLLLVIAGARVGLLPGLWAFIAAYVVLRLVAKLMGGWVLRLVAAGEGRELPRRMGLHLLSPGIVAVAFALAVFRVAGDLAGPLLVVAVAGSIVSEAISVLARRTEHPS